MKLFCILIFALFFHPLNGMEITIPALPVSSPGTEAEASIVIDPEGNMTAVWSEQEVILVSDLPLHGTWSIPVFLSDVLKSASSPKMEIDPAGNVTVLWREGNNVKAATRPFKGSWCISAMTPTFLPLRSEKSDEPTLSDSAPLNTVLALTPNGGGGGGGEARDSKNSRSTGGTLRVKTAPQKENSSPNFAPTEKSPYLPMSTNAIDAPSGGVLSGLQVGFAAGTSAPTGGAIISGQVGIGTSSPAATAALAITSTTQGFLPPVMTTTQQNAISSPATGLQVYNSTLKSPTWYNGSAWLGWGVSSIASPGYQTLPGGLILQWGSSGGGNPATVTFPLAFPNNVFSITCTPDAPDGTFFTVLILSSSKTAFSVDSNAGGSGKPSFFWMAIGN